MGYGLWAIRMAIPNSTPYTLHPTPYTLYPTPYTLHPTLYTLHSTPYTLHTKPINSLLLLADNLIPCPCYEDAHQGADEVEEAVGEVGEGGHAEDGGLGHSAGVPGDEHGGDGDGIFGGAA